MTRKYQAPTPRGTENITTERLDLRPFKRRDAVQMAAWTRDDAFRQYFLSPVLDSAEQAEIVIDGLRSRYPSENSLLCWCISEAASGDAVGEISATLDMCVSSAEIEYNVSPSSRGKGYATEAISAVIGYLHAIGVHRVMAKISTENSASTKAAEKSGMQLEGICQDGLVDRMGMYYDVAIFAHVVE